MKSIYKALLIFVLLVYFFSCAPVDEYSKRYCTGRSLFGGKLFIEKCHIDTYGFNGDIYSLYITDSLTFRKRVDKWYDMDSWGFNMVGDSIYIVKNMYEDQGEKIEYTFKYSELVSNGIME